MMRKLRDYVLRKRTSQRGMVTIEIAIGVMSVVILAVIVSWMISLFAVQASCNDYAAQIARAESRGDEQLSNQVQNKLPELSNVSIAQEGQNVRVVVSMEKYYGKFGPIHVEGQAVMPNES